MTDTPVKETGLTTLGIQVLVGTGMSGTDSRIMATASAAAEATVEVRFGLPRKGSEFVNSTKTGTARKVRRAAICTHDSWGSLDTAIN